MAKMKEAELYEPVKRFFEARGCLVRGEVLNCDLVALHDETVYVVELKASCNLTVILQAVARMRVSNYVYIAIPRPTRRQLPLWKELLRLCDLTGIGLLTVSFIKNGAFVTEEVIARHTGDRLNKKRRASLIHETQERVGDYNVGGTTKQKRMTAYRQLSLLCAALIAEHGPSSPKQLREQLLQAKIPGLLQANVYDWFVRVSKGVYDLSTSGRQALLDYQDVLRDIRAIRYNIKS